MKVFRIALIVAVLAIPGLALADTVLVSKMHQDAIKTPAGEQPAKDYTQTVWLAPQMLRIDGENSVLIRLDTKKMYMLDAEDKVAYSVDLPIDVTKLVSAEQAPILQQLAAMKMAVTLTPTEETKKIKNWNTKRSNLEITNPMGFKMTTVLWTTKDVKLDLAQYRDMMAILQGTNPMMENLAKELQKLDGVTALSETTMQLGDQSMKMSEELLSADAKPAPKGTYDVPEGYAVKPFNFLEQMQARQQKQQKPKEAPAAPAAPAPAPAPPTTK